MLAKQLPLAVDISDDLQNEIVFIFKMLIRRGAGHVTSRRHPAQREIRHSVSADLVSARNDQSVPHSVGKKFFFHEKSSVVS
jgi:hypothetical protein